MATVKEKDVQQKINAPFPMNVPCQPTFPDREYNIAEYGAESGGEIKNTEAVNATIEACAAAGGGRVMVPEGLWLTGAVHLKSNVNLHLAEGATLRFSDDPDDYLPAVFVRWSGVECYNYSPLIYANECENIAVTGKGSLDGNGEKWWKWKEDRELKSNLQNLHAEADGIPVRERVYGTSEYGMRPQFIAPIQCRNVLIEDISINSGPFWTVQLTYCEEATVRGIHIDNYGPNNDGVNVDSSRNVLIENSFFNTGDDSICMKSGMNEDGLRVNRPTENVVVRHCRTQKGHGGVVLGSDTSGGVRNLYVHDCEFDGTNIGIRLKTIKGRGGVVEKLWFENIHMGLVEVDAIRITMFYHTRTHAKKSQEIPIYRDIHFKNVVCDHAGEFAFRFEGVEESPIHNLHFEDVQIKTDKGLKLDYCEALNMKNCQIIRICSYGSE